jgi:hypothetical protein
MNFQQELYYCELEFKQIIRKRFTFYGGAYFFFMTSFSDALNNTFEIEVNKTSNNSELYNNEKSFIVEVNRFNYRTISWDGGRLEINFIQVKAFMEGCMSNSDFCIDIKDLRIVQNPEKNEEYGLLVSFPDGDFKTKIKVPVILVDGTIELYGTCKCTSIGP